MSYRIGVVAYLNAKPLTWAIEQGEVNGLTAVPAVPSELGRQLLGGELDAAIVSSIVAIEHPELALLPAAGCIAADGPVQSVLLFSRVHFTQIRSVALDTSSLTSVALTKLLLERKYGCRPSYQAMAPNLPAMLDACDAALLIGDPSLAQYFQGTQHPPAYDVLDLGRAWQAWTGLPFVFAAWVAPRQLAEGDLPQLLGVAREQSRHAIPAIAAAEAARLQLPVEVCEHYLRQVIRYEFGEREWAGFREFQRMWREFNNP